MELVDRIFSKKYSFFDKSYQLLIMGTTCLKLTKKMNHNNTWTCQRP
jgi:hypothetical protein